MADYILYLENGKSVFSGDIETLRESYRLVTGEPWQIKAIARELVIHVEEGEHGTRALVKNSRRLPDDRDLTVVVPTIEELMYFITKR